nr:YqaE/Pmp3 family membrane protein [Methylobacterium organophilum]
MEPGRAYLAPGVPVSSLVRILLAIFFPPIAVLVTTGFGLQFLLNILLWILGWLPGTVHALWLMNRDRPLV